MSHDTVQLIELNIARAKEILELEKSLNRLASNQDFRKVVLVGYFEKEAVRLVHLKCDPSYQTPERQAAIDKDIVSIGGLVQYFRTVEHNAAIAEKSIEADQFAREELLAEGEDA